MNILTDHNLIALALREHAQTCDEISFRHLIGSDNAKRWAERAQRCRDLAVRHDNLDQLGSPQAS